MLKGFYKWWRLFLQGLAKTRKKKSERVKKNPYTSKEKHTKRAKKLPDLTIVLDPGHGGHDTGAVSGNKVEKTANLQTALTLKYLISKQFPNVKVVLTRSTDYKPTYSHRTHLVVKTNADFFISIHYNSPNTYGLVYYKSEIPDKYSKTLAEYISKSCKSNRVWPSTSSRFGRLYIDNVIKKVPAILVEVDPIDKYQNTKEYRLQKAQCILDGLVNFINDVYKGDSNG